MAKLVAAPLLQTIDRWVGVPVCLLLSLAEKLGRIVYPLPPAPEKPQKILFVKFAEQGSTVLAQSAIRRAAALVGKENLYFVVFEENRFILDVLGLVPEENVIPIKRDTLSNLFHGALEALRKIRSLGIDTAIDMEFFSRSSATLTWMTQAPRRIGFHTFFGEGPYRGDLLTHRLLYNPYLHTSQIFEQMVLAASENPAQLPTWNVPPSPLESEAPRFTPKPGEIEQMKTILRQVSNGGEPKEIILLNPNASDLLPLRKWPTERYIQLAQRLLERFPEAHIVLTGAANEAGPASEVTRSIGSPRCVSLAGRTSLRQLMVLYTLSDLLITNDSGPAHFAALTPVHVLTLFGPETPSLFGAPTPRSTAIWLGLACSPCVNAYNNRQSPCRNNLCMQGITVDWVFDKAVCILEERKADQEKANLDRPAA
ncbi:MAG: glycosyltransferase family 9 protein [Verrucomicrobia bacterium]|nr:glycosyltransferase family 9 protein [Verrucomicrobiota bacterium]